MGTLWGGTSGANGELTCPLAEGVVGALEETAAGGEEVCCLSMSTSFEGYSFVAMADRADSLRNSGGRFSGWESGS